MCCVQITLCKCIYMYLSIYIDIFTHPIFLGFRFLVRNEEKNDIPCQGTRKIRGISKLKFSPVPYSNPIIYNPYYPLCVLLFFITHWMVGNKIHKPKLQIPLIYTWRFPAHLISCEKARKIWNLSLKSQKKPSIFYW